MDSNLAAEHLQVIRTLMERSAVYRRALAPVMIFAGALGLSAAVVGWKLGIIQPKLFVGYWYGVAAVGVIGAFMMVRRQGCAACADCRLFVRRDGRCRHERHPDGCECGRFPFHRARPASGLDCPL